ncbi:MAG TPA: hypothetical protein VE545_06865 [Candidatus Dormibacteraeota bacterium]|jgi:hypothetical protein|nr:hypothetical protein [Candidatus Dormibacteraeota bacterium]
MANPISAVHSEAKTADVGPQTTAPPQAQKTAALAPKSAAVPSDTVTISNAAKAALQEATETKSQTAKEAQSGDHQAQRLLAKENSAQSAK